jgi:nicotinate-nucleotide adenylyltransferase
MHESSRPERLGIFGGTFDPPHVGHIAAAVNVRDALGLDRVLLTVANDPWQKRGTRPVSAAVDRLAMVEAAVAGVEGLEADGREIARGGPSYTVDTLAELRLEDPSVALFLVLGRDAAAGLRTWHEPDRLARWCTVAVVDRQASDDAALPDAELRWVLVGGPVTIASSTEIRAVAAAGGPLDDLVPRGVASLIRERRLYSLGR